MSASLAVLTVALKLGATPKQKLARAKAILAALVNNPNFSTPSPTLAALQALVSAVDLAQVAIANKTGNATTRDAKLKAMVVAFKHLRDYLQGVCELQTDNFVAMAESAAVSVITRRVTPKQALTVSQGKLSGSVDLDAQSAGSHTTNYWQLSGDGKNWSNAPDTSEAKTTVPGLTLGQMYWFRHAWMRKNVRSDWSQVVFIIVK